VNARDVWTLYLHELRSAMRERSVVIYSLLIPAVLYPALVWLAWSGASLVLGQTSDMNARVALVGVPAAHAALRGELDAEKGIDVVDPGPAGEPVGAEALRAGSVDAILEWSELTGAGTGADTGTDAGPRTDTGADAGAGTGAGHFTATVVYDGSKERSEAAATRLTEAVRAYRDRWLSYEGKRRGISPASWATVKLTSKSVASGREMGAFLLKLVIPMLLLVMTSIGCFYPAVDATAGERERSTWETLMTVGASRTSIVLAKYLYVATFGAAAGLLNLASMVISLRAIFASALGSRAGDVRLAVPLSAIPLTALCAVLIALLVAAVMMILASLARTFKEGQAMITPFYLAIALPAVLLQSPDIELTPALSAIPLVNVTMTFREAITGTYRPSLLAITGATQLAAIAVCVAIAARLTRYEDVIAGSSEGAPAKLLFQRIRRRFGGGRGGAKEGAR
jgi:sodium transport system permease protein